ncbi:MAG TPA: NADH-quinone oxidoreductase subunit NuoE family protein [Candidatus Tripitaka californicus]|uniref:NADH-quinone oxidoreductase subunit NuoE family protein n=1 Tax=Candidatus Tripitaka californicus TaxID=3367616 RepID=UPI004026D26E
MKKETLKQEAPVELGGLERHIKNLNHRLSRSDLIPLLQYTQDSYGYLPKPALEFISRSTRISLSRIFGVATFYSQFSFVPKGKFTVKVCVGTACHVRGAEKVKSRIGELLGVKDGETTVDYRFTLESVACLGTCALGPIVVIGSSKKAEGCCGGPVKQTLSLGDKFYGQVSPEKVQEILGRYTKENQP